MFRAIAMTLVGLALVPMGAGCGRGGERAIATQAALAAIREAGFRVRTLETTAFLAERGVTEVDVITTNPRASGFSVTILQRLEAARYPTVQLAKETYEQTFSPRVLERLIPVMRRLNPLPRDFSLAKLRTARVCNIIVSSYNAKRDPLLDARIDRALLLLQKCREE